jgi:hypothetical protein
LWYRTTLGLHDSVPTGKGVFFFVTRQPQVGQGLFVVAASRPHSDTTHSVGLLWMSDQLVAEK